MSDAMSCRNRLRSLSCLDSPAMADQRREELNIPRSVAAELGRTAVEAADKGCYLNEAGERVD